MPAIPLVFEALARIVAGGELPLGAPADDLDGVCGESIVFSPLSQLSILLGSLSASLRRFIGLSDRKARAAASRSPLALMSASSNTACSSSSGCRRLESIASKVSVSVSASVMI